MGGEKIKVTCNCCRSVNELGVNEFRENNAYPPTVHFMCKTCGLMASLGGQEIPPLIFSKLVKRISDEYGITDRVLFERMKEI